MSANTPDVQVLLAQNEELRARLEEAEDALRAIRAGEVDALVVESAGGPQIFTLQGVDAESNRFRGELLAQVRDAVIVVDDEQRLTYLNASAERQYGVAAADVIGLPIDRMYETRWPAAEAEGAARKALCDTGHWHGELTHVTRSGATMQVEMSVTRLRAVNGTGPGQIAVIRDITAEHALRVVARQQQILVEQNGARLKRVLDQLIVFVWIVDLDGRLLECNAAPLQRAGIEAGDVIGKPVWESWWVLHDAAMAQRLREAAQRAAQGETVRCDFRFRFAGGELLMVDLQLAPLRDDAGRIISVIASGVDVQARVTALGDLEKSEARAVDASRRLDAEHRMLQATLEAARLAHHAAVAAHALDLAAAERTRAEAELAAASRLSLPVTVGFGRTRLRQGGWSDDGLRLEVGVGLPLFDRRQGERARARAALSLAEARYEREQRQVAIRSAALLEQARVLAASAERIASQLLPEATALTALARASFSEGELDLIALLDAYDTEAALVERGLSDRLRALDAALALEALAPSPGH